MFPTNLKKNKFGSELCAQFWFKEEFRNRGGREVETVGDDEEGYTFDGVAAPLVAVG
jgi:hypothetical protein